MIFRDEGEVNFLILRYPANHWDFVKGHMEEGEDEIETVLRETEEETGIKGINILFGFREEIEYFYRGKGELHHKEVVYYLAETSQEEVRISHEHKGFDWLSYDEALDRLTFKNSKDVLRRARRFLEGLGYKF